jgi:glutathione S-transferase
MTEKKGTYRLHGFCQSGNTFKVAFCLLALGQKFETVFVDYMSGATRDAAWRSSTNEMGEAPVLEDGAKRMTQSGMILKYLSKKHGKLGGRTPEENEEILRWILFDNHKFTSYFATYRFMVALAPSKPDPAVLAFLKTRMDGAYGIVDKHLEKRQWMVGSSPTIADISLSGYLFFGKEESGYDVDGAFPSIAAWRERLNKIPGWASPYDVLPGARIPPKWVTG